MRRALHAVCRALTTLVLILTLVACSERNSNAVRIQFVNADGTESPILTAEVASTPGDRALGLMYRKELPGNAGMLFVFPDEAPRSFWMKNTFLPLDIIFVSGNSSVVSIVAGAVPHSETPRASEGPARYVVEVLAGNAAQWHLEKGSKLNILDQLPPAK